MFVSEKMRTPNNFWRYTQPETGMRFREMVYGVLLAKVKHHCYSNKIPFDAAEFEDRLCRNLGDNSVCSDGTAEKPVQVKRTTIDDATAFIKVAGEWMKEGHSWVPQEEAERRAAICAACPENQHIAGCSGCRNLVGKLTGLLGGRKTEHDSKLQGCRVCGCSNVAQVHIPLAALSKGIKDDMEFPEHCWKKPTK
jgi:hypothetical protein